VRDGGADDPAGFAAALEKLRGRNRPSSATPRGRRPSRSPFARQVAALEGVYRRLRATADFP